MNVLILGTRGIPAQYGGFETFAENFSRYLVARGHSVVVYCQSDTEGAPRREIWQGIELVQIYGGSGPRGTIAFDLACVRDAVTRPGIILTLGYNTAVFSLLYWLHRRRTLMNMDGIEWRREKWSPIQRLWLRINEFAGAKLSTHLIADHPGIAGHLERLVNRDKITMIPYGADRTDRCCMKPACSLLSTVGLVANEYALIIARPEPENSLLEMVQAFSTRPRGIRLAVLGNYDPANSVYHRKVMDSASPEVLFLGPVYHSSLLSALRCNALLYLHGHRVGGTNPALVEALSTQNAILAHDNIFNSWVAGPGSAYFKDAADLDLLLDELIHDKPRLEAMRKHSRAQHERLFLQEPLLRQYEELLERFADV